MTTLKDASGEPFTASNFDGEGITLTRGGDLLVSSETEPSIRRFSLDGELLEELPVPQKFRVAPAGEGQRNQTFESLSLSPNGRSLFTANEGHLLADGVAELEDAGKRSIVAGDLNAFEDESALRTLEDGTTTLDNLWDEAPEQERYSFAFQGKLQTLDHILITNGLKNRVGDFRYAHFDNDYYERDDPTDGHHVSDHDPPILTLSK